MTNMKSSSRSFLAFLSLAASAATASAQYSPAPPRPYPGFINDKLRASDPYMAAWDIGVNVRGRLEAKDEAGFTSAGSNWDFASTGSGNARDNNNTYFLTRVMPRVGYTDKWYQLFAEARSSSSIDDERENNSLTAPGKGLAENDSDLNLHQAYVFVGNHKEFPLSAKLGRQELVYGDQRQVGHFRWNNNARVFDAAKLRYQHAWFGVDAFTGGVVYNDNHNFNKSHPDTDLFSGLYFNFPKLSNNNLIEAFVYNRNVGEDSPTEDFSGVAAPFRNPVIQDLYTAGLRVKSKPNAFGPWDYSAELMHQFGTINNRNAAGAALGPAATTAAIRSAPEKDQDAYAAILGAGYTWTESTMQPRLALIYSYASGDGDATDGKSGTFQNQFATTHLHYGYMDLNSLQNLHDIRLALTFKPHTTVTVALEGHLQYLDKTTDYWYNVAGVARSAGGYANALGSQESELGQELDLVVGWYPTLYTHVELGVSHYFAGDYIKENLTRNGSSAKDSSYVYLQLTLNL
jgi:Alginate export